MACHPIQPPPPSKANPGTVQMVSKPARTLRWSPSNTMIWQLYDRLQSGTCQGTCFSKRGWLATQSNPLPLKLSLGQFKWSQGLPQLLDGLHLIITIIWQLHNMDMAFCTLVVTVTFVMTKNKRLLADVNNYLHLTNNLPVFTTKPKSTNRPTRTNRRTILNRPTSN